MKTDPEWMEALAAKKDELVAAREARDELVVEAFKADVPAAHIAKAVDVSRMQVYRIVEAAKS